MKKITKEMKSVLAICLAMILCYLKFQSYYFLVIAGILVITSILYNPAVIFIHKYWMKLALTSSRLMQPVIFSIVFFVILTPLALLQRLFAKNAIQLKNNSATTFVEVKKKFNSNHFENPW
ncbi:MAG: hypothetical protein HY062_07095 [Bacteroidetes bacterium]|nr:hypothetical protein [Bacteroidota bacterium]